MSKWFVVHEGTGTFFSLDDTAFIVNAENLTDDEIDGIEWLDVPEGTTVISMSSQLVDDWLK